jgi:DNA-binding NarL/FixJ family response regulator
VLTAREQELLDLLVTEGLSNAELGRAMGIRPQTVKKLLASVMNKTGYSTRLELAVRTLHQRFATTTPKTQE